MRYVYLGDRITAPALRGASCDPVRRADGKCIRGRNGSQLVRFADGVERVVVGRRLRVVGDAWHEVGPLGRHILRELRDAGGVVSFSAWGYYDAPGSARLQDRGYIAASGVRGGYVLTLAGRALVRDL